MKRIICFFIVMVTILTLCISVSAVDGKPMLSEMSDEECLAFLLAYGIEIPRQYTRADECVPFVKYIIAQVERNSNALFGFGYAFLQEFAEEIRNAVNDYYGVYAVTARINSSENILEENTVIGTWRESYREYNCYAYAIAYGERIDPGEIAYNNGDIDSGESFYDYLFPSDATIYALANLVRRDLLSLGYYPLFPTTTLPNVQITEHLRVICIRKDEDVTQDYHLMTLSEDGSWTHKPGASIPLKYNYALPNLRVWTQEGLVGDQYFRNEDCTYDSDIYYIVYAIPCTSEQYEHCGNNTHILTCTQCGKTSGSAMACSYSYEYTGNNAHILTCLECKNTKGMALSCSYIDGICSVCGSFQSLAGPTRNILGLGCLLARREGERNEECTFNLARCSAALCLQWDA